MPDRAIIAISDDSEWLVALDRQPAPYNGRIHFGIYAWHSGEIAYTSFDFVPDTGQSAEEVLANYLASRKK